MCVKNFACEHFAVVVVTVAVVVVVVLPQDTVSAEAACAFTIRENLVRSSQGAGFVGVELGSGCSRMCVCVCMCALSALLQQDIRFRTQTDFDTGPHTVAKKGGRQTQNEAAQSRRAKCSKNYFPVSFCHLNKAQFCLRATK